MRIKALIDEDFTNYKTPSMFIGMSTCNWKCCIDGGFSKDICQNSALASSKTLNIPNAVLYSRYVNNDISKAIVIGGLEPFLQFEELLSFIITFRKNNIFDDIVIYTGYNKNEINPQLLELMKFKNIIVKFGRYVPHQKPHKDLILGVCLASDNQYAEKIS